MLSTAFGAACFTSLRKATSAGRRAASLWARYCATVAALLVTISAPPLRVVGEAPVRLDVVDDADDDRLDGAPRLAHQLPARLALVDHEHAVADAGLRAVDADARLAAWAAVGPDRAQEQQRLALEHRDLHRRDDRSDDFGEEHQASAPAARPTKTPFAWHCSTKPRIAASTGTKVSGQARAPSRPSTKCTRSPGPVETTA